MRGRCVGKKPLEGGDPGQLHGIPLALLDPVGQAERCFA